MSNQPAPTGLDRRGFLTLAAAGVAGASMSVVVGALAPAAASAAVAVGRKRELRAMWISSVVNIDWPSASGLSAEQQRAELVGWLDTAVEWRLNAVFVQVRPTADAFWPSPLEPWSQYLTGTQGQDPGYDPLAFLVAEAHARNLELHTWYNPYRVSMQADPTQLVPEHPARVHPEWVWPYGGKLYFDPGLPAAREHIWAAILDSVERYDIDGVHFDDYFYPYPVAGAELPDADTYATHGGGFASIEAWRRDNVDVFVQGMAERIKATKPWVKFGISPFGIWRNAATDPLGSATSGSQSYDTQFADTRRWVLEGWLDYINPQIYWQIGLAVADYAALVPWWADVAAASATHLYVGEALYKVTSGVFTDPAELANHIDLCLQQSDPVHGNVYFSAKHVPADPQGAMSIVRERHWMHPAIIPAMEHLPATPIVQPSITSAQRTDDGVQVRWRDRGPTHAKATSFAVYRVSGRRSVVDVERAANLVAVVRSPGGTTQSWVDEDAPTGDLTYVVTALDRAWNESAASRPAWTR